ncbi:MAG TPA: SCP2 sterol-binding domain-containing protein [Azospira sp.]|nr:SCP2 sterol-binding domain-containing protein [Azospira sp.]
MSNFSIPTFKLPAFVARLGARLPQWPHALALVSGLNAAARLKVLPEDSLATMAGKTVLVGVNDTGGEAVFTYANGWFRPVFSPAGAPDLIFRADLSAYLQLMSRQEDPDTLFFNRQLSIEGDTELGLVVKNMLDAIEWPPSLAQVPGLERLAALVAGLPRSGRLT